MSCWAEAGEALARGSAKPSSCRFACRRSSQQKVPEVKGPCSNHDTICWREGYSSATLMSLSSAPFTLVILTGSPLKQPEGRALQLLAPRLCTIWALLAGRRARLLGSGEEAQRARHHSVLAPAGRAKRGVLRPFHPCLSPLPELSRAEVLQEVVAYSWERRVWRGFICAYSMLCMAAVVGVIKRRFLSWEKLMI
ncbi:uncharacterized [Tachysurus ichikawai]